MIFLALAVSMIGAKTEQTNPVKIWLQNENGWYYTLTVVDEDTGVNYIVVSAERCSYSPAVAITPRLNADGTLYVSK
jgi:hypothetical protein